jgi:cold shock CspA family protein
MLTGTVSDFDSDGLFGVINAEDGRLLLFNLRGIPPPLHELFRIGTRVQFVERESDLAPRAISLVPLDVEDNLAGRGSFECS